MSLEYDVKRIAEPAIEEALRLADSATKEEYQRIMEARGVLSCARSSIRDLINASKAELGETYGFQEFGIHLDEILEWKKQLRDAEDVCKEEFNDAQKRIDRLYEELVPAVHRHGWYSGPGVRITSGPSWITDR